MHIKTLLLLPLSLWISGETLAAVSAQYQSATQARVNGTYMMVVFADGTKSMVPTASLKPEDHEWLLALSRKKPMAAGKYRLVWDAKNDRGLEVPSGQYFYRFTAGRYVKTRKMILVK